MDSKSIFVLIVGILTFNYLLGRFLSYLNDTRRSTELPQELEGIYDEGKYKKQQEYDKENSRFSMLTATFSFTIMLLMLLFDGFAWVDGLVTTMTDHAILAVLLFFGILGLASDIIGIPFSLYGTFVIEEKYGFNRTTVKTFILDKLKGYLLGGLIGGGLLALFVWFYDTAGDLFWVYAWSLFSGFALFMTAFYASIIVPLFNKLTPLESGSLREAIEDYCKKVNFKLNDLFVMDGSKRSAKANAFFSGLGAKKKIVLYDTLIENHTKEELVAVLAHEAGHFKKKHTRSSLIISILQTGLMMYILSLVIGSPALSQALGVQEQSFHIGLLVFSLLYSPLSMIMGIGMNMLSRKNEYEADAFARDTYNGEALASALKKLSVDNLSNLTPHPFYVFLNYSHPTLLQRLNALKIAD
ncbi:MAG TPA: M48 family peptidase [Flavobacteriales bacterium]|nr:M48 family peptidase [Flavobacteriales bacterium]HIN40145.1 M48 family peptidase [Flavobacteriales bacterium]